MISESIVMGMLDELEAKGNATNEYHSLDRLEAQVEIILEMLVREKKAAVKEYRDEQGQS